MSARTAKDEVRRLEDARNHLAILDIERHLREMNATARSSVAREAESLLGDRIDRLTQQSLASQTAPPPSIGIGLDLEAVELGLQSIDAHLSGIEPALDRLTNRLTAVGEMVTDELRRASFQTAVAMLASAAVMAKTLRDLDRNLAIREADRAHREKYARRIRAQERFEEATLHFQIGKYDACARALEEALSAQASHAAAHLLGGRVARAKGDVQEAIRKLNDAMAYSALDPIRQPEVYLLAAQERTDIFLKTQAYSEAFEKLQEACNQVRRWLANGVRIDDCRVSELFYAMAVAAWANPERNVSARQMADQLVLLLAWDSRKRQEVASDTFWAEVVSERPALRMGEMPLWELGQWLDKVRKLNVLQPDMRKADEYFFFDRDFWTDTDANQHRGGVMTLPAADPDVYRTVVARWMPGGEMLPKPVAAHLDWMHTQVFSGVRHPVVQLADPDLGFLNMAAGRLPATEGWCAREVSVRAEDFLPGHIRTVLAVANWLRQQDSPRDKAEAKSLVRKELAYWRPWLPWVLRDITDLAHVIEEDPNLQEYRRLRDEENNERTELRVEIENINRELRKLTGTPCWDGVEVGRKLGILDAGMVQYRSFDRNVRREVEKWLSTPRAWTQLQGGSLRELRTAHNRAIHLLKRMKNEIQAIEDWRVVAEDRFARHERKHQESLAWKIPLAIALSILLLPIVMIGGLIVLVGVALSPGTSRGSS